jgi:hypothetical protein
LTASRPTPDNEALKPQTETANAQTPIRRGRRSTTAVSDAHTVEGAADSWMRPRKLKLPTLPKLAPSTDTVAPPDEALQTAEMDNMLSGSCTASGVNEATVLEATLRDSTANLPLIADMRHSVLVSLVHAEPAHAVTIMRAAGDDATLANACPDSTAFALPVVGKRNADGDAGAVDMPSTTGSG